MLDIYSIFSAYFLVVSQSTTIWNCYHLTQLIIQGYKPELYEQLYKIHRTQNSASKLSKNRKQQCHVESLEIVSQLMQLYSQQISVLSLVNRVFELEISEYSIKFKHLESMKTFILLILLLVSINNQTTGINSLQTAYWSTNKFKGPRPLVHSQASVSPPTANLTLQEIYTLNKTTLTLIFNTNQSFYFPSKNSQQNLIQAKFFGPTNHSFQCNLNKDKPNLFTCTIYPVSSKFTAKFYYNYLIYQAKLVLQIDPQALDRTKQSQIVVPPVVKPSYRYTNISFQRRINKNYLIITVCLSNQYILVKHGNLTVKFPDSTPTYSITKSPYTVNGPQFDIDIYFPDGLPSKKFTAQITYQPLEFGQALKLKKVIDPNQLNFVK